MALNNPSNKPEDDKINNNIKKPRLITSALPYVNNVPHLGNIIGSVLSADVFARYCRIAGYKTLYICGTDEYGTATEIKAREEHVSPKQICDKYHQIHKQVYDWFNISFDYFGRTSTENHTKITQDIFWKLYHNGYIIEEEIEQFYDPEAKIFLADRYIEGTCPHCNYDNARGDQCDKCGKLLNPLDLINPKSKITGVKPILKKTKHLFLDLEKLQPVVEKWVESMHNTWSENTYNIAKSWINIGLKKRSITRDLKWGVPVPLEGFEDKVFYVWFDAPIGYISITADNLDNWKEWWENPNNVNLYQFMGKDNVPFHTVIFPATLMGTNQNWTLARTISATEYLNYEGGKFSKSRGTGVFGTDAINSGIPADVWRYYLLINRPEKSDTDFKWDDFSDKLNNELVANLGNLVNRTVTFLNRYFDGIVPNLNSKKDNQKIEHINDIIPGYKQHISEIEELLEDTKLKEALRKIMEISSLENKYFQDSAPWKLIKQDKSRANTVLCVLANIVKDLGILTYPYLPDTSDKIFDILNIDKKNRTWDNLNEISLANHKINKPKLLFKKIEEKQIEQFKKKFGSKATPADLDIEIGEIIEIKRHPNADKLYVEKVKLGDKIIDLVSGLVPFFKEDELLHRHIMIIRNLKKAKIRGAPSEGMLLAVEAKDENGNPKLELLGEDLPVGTKIAFEGIKQKPKDVITIDELFSLKPHVKNGNLIIGGKLAIANGKYVQTKHIKDGDVY